MRFLWMIFSVLLPCSGLLHYFGLGYYSPAAIVLLVPLGLLGIGKSIVERTTPLWQFLLLLFVVAYAACGAFHLSSEVIDRKYILSREAVTVLGTLAFIGIALLFRSTTTGEAARRLMLGVDFTLIIIAIEAASFYHAIPGTVKEHLNTFFSARETIRIQGPTQEASFVGAYLAALFPYAMYNVTVARSPRNIARITAMAGCLLMVLSLQGLLIWLTGIAAGLGYFMLHHSRRLALVVAGFAVAAFAALGLAGAAWYQRTEETTVPDPAQPNYVSSRLAKIRELKHPQDFLFLDYSVFNRLSAPYYGLRAGVTRPLGVGPGGFGSYYSRELSHLDDARVQEFLTIRFLGDAEDTKSLIIQYFAEVGVLSVLFVAALILCWRQRFLQAGRPEEKALAIALLAVFAVMTLNAGSMLNLIFWICLVPLQTSGPRHETPDDFPHARRV